MRHLEHGRRMAAALVVGMLVAAAGAVTVLRTSEAQALGNGVARTPPMGWNS
ncbi:hypothetical protein [Micromonospora sp. CPCC 206061]|uniref:hypothetical protein n=1 Tax=Micromonospora sp. CPCC 206061 TaxID=3122410 RepID=UPI003FA5C65B